MLEGRLAAEIGGSTRTYSAGEAFIIQAGVDHSLAADVDAHSVVEFTPPLNTAKFMRALHRFAVVGLVDRWGWPTPLSAAAITREFREDFVVAISPELHRIRSPIPQPSRVREH